MTNVPIAATIIHVEKMARVLDRWLDVYEELSKCDRCTAPHEQCPNHSPELKQLAQDTRRLLAAGTT